MRKLLIITALLLASLTLPAFAEEDAGSQAAGLSNELRLFLDGVGGEWEDDVSGDKGETATSSLGIGYAHFFRPLETTDAPYAMRRYLQHPSTLSASLVSYAVSRDWDGSVVEAEAEGSMLSLGGMYFGERTGFGAEVTFGSEELKIDALAKKEETESSAIALRLEHYTSERTRIHVSLESERSETDDKNSTMNNEEAREGMLRFGVSSLIDQRIWLSGELGTGRRKHEDLDTKTLDKYNTGSLSLEFGYFFSQRLGLMVSLSGESYEHTKSGVIDEGGRGMFSVGVEYYPSETGYFGVALESVSETEKTATEDTESSAGGLRLHGGFLF